MGTFGIYKKEVCNTPISLIDVFKFADYDEMDIVLT